MADDNVKFNLAVSLHSAIDEVRTSIMPFNVTFPLQDLKEALQYWYTKTKNRITYEYVVWEGINDTKKDVEALIEFCKSAPSKINLIEYNPIDDGEFQQASSKAIDMYVSMLEKNNITVTVRRSRGKDIDAACGQLANKKLNKKEPQFVALFYNDIIVCSYCNTTFFRIIASEFISFNSKM